MSQPSKVPAVRPLSQDFIEQVAIESPPNPASSIGFGRTLRFTADETRMQGMNDRKEAALTKYWSHLRKITTFEDTFVARDRAERTIRIYTPLASAISPASPRVVYSMHGGGFVAGNLDSEDLINRQLCRESNVVIFSVDYRLAPEFNVVTTIYADAEDGLTWTLANAEKYGGDVSRGVVLSGTSVGATMASVMAYRSTELGLTFKGMLLRQPGWIFGKYEDLAKAEWLPRLKSREENKDAPLLNLDMLMNNILRLSGVTLAEAADPRNFPIFSSKEVLARMPPAYLVAAMCDPVVDEVLLFADLLKDNGVAVKVEKYDGVPHGFHQHHVLKAARQEMADTVEGLKWLLSF